MITLDATIEQEWQYLQLETKLLALCQCGVLTLKEVEDILDRWLTAREQQ